MKAPKVALLIALGTLLAGCGAAPPPPPKKAQPKTQPPSQGHACDRIPTLESAPEPLDPVTAPVVRVEVRGVDAPAEICAAIQSHAGSAVNETTVAADLHRIWALGSVDDVTVEREVAPGGVVLAYEITPRPQFRSARIDGIRTAGIGSEDDYLPVPGLAVPARIHAASRKIEHALSDQGFRHATTTTRIERGDDGNELVIDVNLGVRQLVSHIGFVGVDPKRGEEILHYFVTHTGAPLVAEALERDVLIVSSYYWDKGMLEVRVHPPKITETGEALEVSIEVDEGPVFKLGTVRFAGDLLDREADYKKRFWSTPPGGVFNRSAIAADMERVREYHRSQGFAADVEPETDLHPDKKLVDFVVKVKKR